MYGSKERDGIYFPGGTRGQTILDLTDHNYYWSDQLACVCRANCDERIIWKGCQSYQIFT